MTNSTKWLIDLANSEIVFKVKQLIFASVKGAFKNFDAVIYTEDKNFITSEVNLWIDVSSINTGDTECDEHLKSADFFDVQNHKQITFTSYSIGKSNSEHKLELWGELTMKGITKDVKLNVFCGEIINDSSGNERTRLKIVGKINRRDWGLVWNASIKTGGLMLSEEVTISCEIELVNIGNNDLVIELEHTVEKIIFCENT